MTSKFRAHIRIDAGPYTKAVYQSILVDNAYYTGPDAVSVTLDDAVLVCLTADRVSHLRAGVNSVLRLAQAAIDSLKSLSYN